MPGAFGVIPFGETAHIFCRQDQIQSEVEGVIDFVFDTMKDFGFEDIAIELSTQPAKHIGSQEDWDTATQALKESLEEKKLDYQINAGDGAFYGPKIDLKLKDALGRLWQCATIQCDFSLPERFDLTYISETGQPLRPIMLHRAILGSLERFIGTLIEHYAGAFPVWFSPVQILLIPIKSEHAGYAQQLKENFQNEGFRVILDARNESLNKRIREGTMKKIPYLLVVGDKEISEKKVAVRKRGTAEAGSMSVDQFVQQLREQIMAKI